MKTFSEACEATFVRIRPSDVPVDEEQISASIAETVAPFESLVEEIQNSQEAVRFSYVLLRMGLDEDVPPVDLLRIAFSHGVMVGIEMEKEPLLVGRSDPHEATDPTEAKP
jgi:hypothetical protein